ncbi:hypothetical protein [Desulfotignum balticum]|uniref:hypothetical protein n=1 Tax=Desulfotignum balticum TaxID=115781 RepID=UPI0003F78FDD|nr:hypothetical protein [Desulfotignum balticum]
MARQFEKPETGRPAASGFLYSGAPCPLDPGQINRGDYCHRHSICSEKKNLDPNQAVCLICNDFLPLFPGVDPLAQARVMGFTVGYKTIKAALAFEAARSGLAAAPSPEPEPTPVPKPKSKLNGRKPRSRRPKPGSRKKRCSNSKCKDPILPATPEYFFRNRRNPDGLSYYCKSCQREKQEMSCRRN